MDNNRTVILTAVITFIIGIVFGYNLNGGSKEKKTDVTQLLTQARTGIEQLEKENRDLKADLERVKKDKTRKEDSVMKDQLTKAQLDNEALTKEVSSLKAQLNKTETKLKSEGEFKVVTEQMKSRISELEKENQDLRQVIDQISSLTKQQELTAPEQPQ